MSDETRREVKHIMDLKDKQVVAIGEREGINGPSLKLLAESAGARVVFSVTQCFV